MPKLLYGLGFRGEQSLFSLTLLSAALFRTGARSYDYSSPSYRSMVRKITSLEKVEANDLKVKTDDMPTVFTLAEKIHRFVEFQSNLTFLL